MLKNPRFMGLMLGASMMIGAPAFAMPIQGVLGVTMSTVDPGQFPAAQNASSSSATGFTLGATTDFDFGSDFGLRTGLLFNQRNGNLTVGGQNFTLTYSYLDIPADFLYWIGDFYVLAGLAIGIKASSTCSGPAGASCNLSDKSLVTPIQIGVGYVISNMIDIGLIYELPGTTISSTSGANSSNINTSAIDVRVGYYF